MGIPPAFGETFLKADHFIRSASWSGFADVDVIIFETAPIVPEEGTAECSYSGSTWTDNNANQIAPFSGYPVVEY